MSNPEVQISQYTDAIKLLKKKCQALKTQLARKNDLEWQWQIESKAIRKLKQLPRIKKLSSFFGNGFNE